MGHSQGANLLSIIAEHDLRDMLGFTLCLPLSRYWISYSYGLKTTREGDIKHPALLACSAHGQNGFLPLEDASRQADTGAGDCKLNQ